jgi:crossover junction endonuclease MUS81
MATFKPFNKKLTPGHPHNKFLMEKFMILKRSADSRHLDNQSSCYRKIIISISKYPMPIDSMEQALMLEGVGQKMAQMVKLMIQ